MNSLICISHVPDTTTKIVFDAEGKALNANGVTFIVNPYDEFGLSRALELKEKSGQGNVVALCVGKADVEPTIRKALAVGADSGVRIDAEAQDAFYVASQIAEYAKGQSFDVIYMGKESIDNNGSEVPGMVAELLGIPYVSFATSLEVEGGKAKITREIDGGQEVLESTFPVILSCQKGIAEWRIPNMRGIMAARTKPLAVVAAAAAEMKTEVIHYELPAPKAGCVMIAPENVDAIVKVLADKGVI